MLMERQPCFMLKRWGARCLCVCVSPLAFCDAKHNVVFLGYKGSEQPLRLCLMKNRLDLRGDVNAKCTFALQLLKVLNYGSST